MVDQNNLRLDYRWISQRSINDYTWDSWGGLFSQIDSTLSTTTYPPPYLCVELLLAVQQSRIVRFTLCEEQHRHICASTAAPAGTYTGSLRGKKMGNQENMLGVRVGGWVLRVTSLYSWHSK